ncbi:MAG: RNA-dependent DNA polymerase [Candidatus Levybacteria bacterium]|nr:RNA-dependent DNA polymerase [Candidatus Levybacteria bacterium]
MTYDNLISIENLFQAWNEFVKGKRKKKDVQEFHLNLEDNLFELHRKLKSKTYKHGDYEDFYINDPKRRHIHKAKVTDRIVHHLLYKYLYSVFDKTFIYDSYSCRLSKGTHRGVKRLENFAGEVSKNYTGECWALKLDIRKFFASVDHKILLRLLKEKIKDRNVLKLLEHVITSFNKEEGRGIPLGNLTSQIFANIYLNELDQFVKHKLRVKYYIRYADDFIIISNTKESLFQYLHIIKEFLLNNLNLELHQQKIIFRKLSWGIDFLGYIVLPYYLLPRTKTKRRILNKVKIKIKVHRSGKISDFSLNQTVQSYLGVLKHANSYKILVKLKDLL